MSITNGDITIGNAMKTYIQMFCGICKKYDCLLHGLKDYDQLEAFSNDSSAVKAGTPCGSSCYLQSEGNGTSAGGESSGINKGIEINAEENRIIIKGIKTIDEGSEVVAKGNETIDEGNKINSEGGGVNAEGSKINIEGAVINEDGERSGINIETSRPMEGIEANAEGGEISAERIGMNVEESKINNEESGISGEKSEGALALTTLEKSLLNKVKV